MSWHHLLRLLLQLVLHLLLHSYVRTYVRTTLPSISTITRAAYAIIHDTNSKRSTQNAASLAHALTTENVSVIPSGRTRGR